MKIGIIGIGNIGGTLARKLSATGHEVRVANSRGVESVRPFAEEIGAIPSDANEAVNGADLVILSIPFPGIAKLPKDLFSKLAEGAPIVDTGNYYPGLRDPDIAELDEGKIESVWVSEQIGRPIIKAFNNILAYSLAELGRPAGSPDRIALAVAGDDAQSKQMVMGIVNEIGFDPVDGGLLSESWRQQPGTPGYCCDYDAEAMRKALNEAVPGKAPEVRNKIYSLWGQLGSSPSHADVINMNRRVHSDY
ncbi:NADPH-dependent F420 reductase [Pseudomonas sp. CFBP 13727]|uniref:NADPH-dependent F420 reductase n=1 Tax=Pseudomonas sp. CFBP 13727 TaxID=2775295 RepID=UPI001784127D|nr:NAD(P)-binding domain-containing protein [Pseudomonas sp. CFBP 13727]MBD8623000.1 NAD(P)-binding domain-containing protein [Pseudomonas sp. CFBP 13727]